jgi:DNA-binding response OmpR family regulator
VTVTPFVDRQPRVLHSAARHGVVAAPFAPATDPTTLTLRVEVRLAGVNRLTEAVEVIDAVRTVTDRLVVDTVDVTCDGLAVEDLLAHKFDPQRRLADDASRGTGHGPAESGRTEKVVVLPELREVRQRGAVVAMTRLEFDLLLFLVNNRRRVFTRGQLLAQVWGFARGGERTVDVHISRLRAKLGEDLITTVRGVGYRLAGDAPVTAPHQAG